MAELKMVHWQVTLSEHMPQARDTYSSSSSADYSATCSGPPAVQNTKGDRKMPIFAAPALLPHMRAVPACITLVLHASRQLDALD